MRTGIRVASPPPKPLMVFDGDCNFCSLWIRRWRQLTGEAVDYTPSQDTAIPARFPEIPPEQFATSVVLVESDGDVYAAAEAVFRALAQRPGWRWPLLAYQNFSWFAALTEWAYHLFARHRTFFSWGTRLLWGRQVERPEYFLTRSVFLRALALVYLVAFGSLWTQVSGLIGHNGILPTDQFMAAAKEECDARGIALERYHWLPTLCWLDASDRSLELQCAAGMTLAALLLVGLAPVPCLALLWLLYLSLMTVGRDFLSFQWDNLLLETGFLAIFLAPWQWWPMRSRGAPPSRLILWLLRLLLFKLVFSSGWVKLASGDPNWRNLTALTFHYQTQPLPPWTAWYAHHASLGMQKFSCAAVLTIELGASLLIFMPRRIRLTGAAALAVLQVLILLSGNYAFFNWLTLALCLLLLDDFCLNAAMPQRWREVLFRQPPRLPRQRRNWPRGVLVGVTLLTLPVSIFLFAVTLGVRPSYLAPLAVMTQQLAPFRTVNNYGLFAIMTTRRDEIIVEGSNDGTNWTAYEFRYKPGDVHRRPAFVAPFQPRLDWQMWFAALGDTRDNPWFLNFCERLLQGSPEVSALLAANPFPEKPPRMIRAELYRYRFTSDAARRASHAWWEWDRVGEYLPPISLQNRADSKNQTLAQRLPVNAVLEP